MEVTFTVPIAGQYPCQAEGFIVSTNEPFYFKQRGSTAILKIFDLPLGESLDQGRKPTQLAVYEVAVNPLAGDAIDHLSEVEQTFQRLVTMHEMTLPQG